MPGELITVAIYHTGEHRIMEYTPTRTRKLGGGGIASHAAMLTKELIPWMAACYRALPHARHTALGGSSVGGLAAPRPLGPFVTCGS